MNTECPRCHGNAYKIIDHERKCIFCGTYWDRKQTHADRIRAMSDEELADELYDAIEQLYNMQDTGRLDEWNQALDMAIEALKKQIAKPFVDNSWWLECPTCHAKGLTPNEQIYCHKCGQMIDWNKYYD